jgi:predicted XRE-type DNA-binding protein
MKTAQIKRSSGNVFADIAVRNSWLALFKVELAATILQVIERKGLTQAAAGKALGIGQPKVSALMHGRLDGFSTDRLLRFLTQLGCDVRISVSGPRTRVPGALRVMAS